MRGSFASFVALAVATHHVAAVNLTDFVNLFVGTATANGGSGGNSFPGAAIPHAMVKVGIDVSTTPRQAGYIADNSTITGISLMHDEGTGGNTAGGYGIFPLFPLAGCVSPSCPVSWAARQTYRAKGTDVAKPGYFTTAFVNGIKLEATSTRRAGLIRFTYPVNATNPLNHVVVDISNDLQRSFRGGSIDISITGRAKLQGTYMQSYGPDNYTVFGCYDFIPPKTSVPLVSSVTFQSASTSSPNTINTNAGSVTSLKFPYTSSFNPTQAGALFSFNSTQVTARFGVSFRNAEAACQNAEEEIPTWDWDSVQETSRSSWEDVLQRVKVDTQKENPTIVQLLYSSLYRASLVPANLTGENPYWDSAYPFYDAFFCSWDTFRTVHPWLSLTSPREWAEIVNAYVDGWRATGYIPECRSNTKAGYVQGGGDGMPILGDWAVKYGAYAEQLGVPANDLYRALVDTAENTPPDWYRVGRQNTAWKTFGYIPTSWTDPSGSTGLATREASRAIEYAVGDFAARQAGIALKKSADDIAKYTNRSMNFVNHWDSSLTHDGFTGFLQRRYPNGTFAYSPPDACSPIRGGFSCARGSDNNVGFYESSSWEYSFYAPHSRATIVRLMGGPSTFVDRVNHYFDKGYFLAGNEPSFEMPWIYHYGNRPDLTALRVRQIIYKNFNTGIGGIPGNDDSGAMASLLIFHLLGLYPITATTRFLIGSPLISSYSLHNGFFNTTTTFTVTNFDTATLVQVPPAGSRLYVKNIKINGVDSPSLCWIDFKDVVGGGNIEIVVDSDATAAAARGCGTGDKALPESLETGGFPAA